MGRKELRFAIDPSAKQRLCGFEQTTTHLGCCNGITLAFLLRGQGSARVATLKRKMGTKSCTTGEQRELTEYLKSL
jgi:hypothetical protein